LLLNRIHTRVQRAVGLDQMAHEFISFAQNLIEGISETTLEITWGHFHGLAKGWLAVLVLGIGLFSCGAINSGQQPRQPPSTPTSAPSIGLQDTQQHEKTDRGGSRPAAGMELPKVFGEIQVHTQRVQRYRKRSVSSCNLSGCCFLYRTGVPETITLKIVSIAPPPLSLSRQRSGRLSIPAHSRKS
jgi:hypothetical protein